ncbi:MAG TPA: demethylmenaquinone methyltransferase [Propionibacteriaceae bacterium]|nr:demethylmenaquinone methyltransferase [Propionibacteriaceae bacterium]
MRQGARATLAKRRAEVSAMFDGVAPRYDLMNDLASLGQDRRWRLAVRDAIGPGPGLRVLDLAAGTGTSSVPLNDWGAFVVPVDMSLGMLEEGRKRHPWLPFVAGDALGLPFADGVFDAVTISFGLRNVSDTVGALAEMLRVTRPGGLVVVCEFSTPTWTPFRAAYRGFLGTALPGMAKVASANPVAYDYLAESILAWPDQQGLADLMYEAGWADVEHQNLSGGIVALHRARRPE